MKSFLLKISVLVSFCLVLSGCDPDELEVEVYTSDVELALEGEIVDVPITVVFSLLGEDEEGTFDKVIEQIGAMLHPDTKFTKAEGNYKESLIIESKIAMCIGENLQNVTYNTPFILEVFKRDDGSARVELKETNNRERISTVLSDINLMLSLGDRAEETRIRVISDSKDPVALHAVSVWVPAATTILNESLERRGSKELTYKGGDSSIYSQFSPYFVLKF